MRKRFKRDSRSKRENEEKVATKIAVVFIMEDPSSRKTSTVNLAGETLETKISGTITGCSNGETPLRMQDVLLCSTSIGIACQRSAQVWK